MNSERIEDDWLNAVIEILIPLDIPLDADQATREAALSDALDQLDGGEVLTQHGAVGRVERFSDRETAKDGLQLTAEEASEVLQQMPNAFAVRRRHFPPALGSAVAKLARFVSEEPRA